MRRSAARDPLAVARVARPGRLPGQSNAFRASSLAVSNSAWRWRGRSWSSREVLLLDEPLSNLDAKLREEMRIELRRIQQALGITAMFVTHDLAEAFALADTVVVMNDGAIRQVGSPSDIYERPADAAGGEFVGIFNRMPAPSSGSATTALAELRTPGADAARVRPAPGCAPATAVMLRVRPERLRLNAAVGAESGPSPRRSSGSIYLGPTVQYLLTAAGMPLIASVPTPSALPRCRPVKR